MSKTAHFWTVRDCGLGDVPAILEFWQEATTPSATDTADDLCRAIGLPGTHVLVAEADGKIVGSVMGAFDGWRGNIYRLAVDPSCRRKGVARDLVAQIEKRLAAAGARRITALVEKDHPWAVSFWEAVAYRQDARIVRHVRNL
jgi:ribosomal protein S18 acetylase RimI-like enzyme